MISECSNRDSSMHGSWRSFGSHEADPIITGINFCIDRVPDDTADASDPMYTTVINRFGEYTFNRPLGLIVQDDDGDKVVSLVDLPVLYGVGDDVDDALKMLTEDLAQLWEEIRDDHSLNGKWKSHRDFLLSVVVS